MNYVIVDTDKGSEVWPNEQGAPLVATFTKRSDAELFIASVGVTADRIHNTAFNIASAFPALNLSNAPVNPNGEFVLKIARIIESDFATTTSPSETAVGGEAQITAMWEALKREACKVPDEAQQIVFLGEQKFRKAMAPFVAPVHAAGDDDVFLLDTRAGLLPLSLLDEIQERRETIYKGFGYEHYASQMKTDLDHVLAIAAALRSGEGS